MLQLHTLIKQICKSAAMNEQHYSNLTATMATEKLV